MYRAPRDVEHIRWLLPCTDKSICSSHIVHSTDLDSLWFCCFLLFFYRPVPGRCCYIVVCCTLVLSLCLPFLRLLFSFIFSRITTRTEKYCVLSAKSKLDGLRIATICFSVLLSFALFFFFLVCFPRLPLYLLAKRPAELSISLFLAHFHACARALSFVRSFSIQLCLSPLSIVHRA